MSRSDTASLQVETGLISVYGVSNPGKKRRHNEDTIFIDDHGRFMLVADGMGGQLNGGRASTMVVDFLDQKLRQNNIEIELSDITQSEGMPPEISGLCSVIENVVAMANRQLYKINCDENESMRGFMGTTLAGIYLSNNGYVIIFHIGDSRVYRLRNGDLTLMTHDHSLYQEWIDTGGEGKTPGKNILTRAIGFYENVEMDLRFSKYMKNDIYLLCSDGLTNMVPDNKITAVLNGHAHIVDSADVLIREANQAGGTDNVSAVLCRITKGRLKK